VIEPECAGGFVKEQFQIAGRVPIAPEFRRLIAPDEARLAQPFGDPFA
jgi:hypothetical protein